jgi:hypothetical protein
VPKIRQNEKNEKKKEYYFVNILVPFIKKGEEIIQFWGNFFF